MKSISKIVKSNGFKRFKGLSSRDVNLGVLIGGEQALYDLENINSRLFHFFNPQGYIGFAKQQHTNTHNYEITNSKFFLPGGLIESQSNS